MRFAIIKGKPYLINQGRAFPIKLLEEGFGIVGEGKKTKEQGVYTLMELRVKLNTLEKTEKTSKAKNKTNKEE